MSQVVKPDQAILHFVENHPVVSGIMSKPLAPRAFMLQVKEGNKWPDTEVT